MSIELGFTHQFMPGSSDRTLFLLHGTGGDENQLVPLGRELDSAAALLSPRGKTLEKGNARFFRRLAEGVFDLEDLRARTDELADFVKAAAVRYEFGLEKLVAVGYSNGANIAASLIFRHPSLLRSAILFRAMVPFEPDELPNLAGTRVWLAAGKQDPLIPPDNVMRLAELLSDAGAEVTARMFDAGHGLTNVELVMAQRWLDEPRA
jgi:phospholipase/carboxylesterase